MSDRKMEDGKMKTRVDRPEAIARQDAPCVDVSVSASDSSSFCPLAFPACLLSPRIAALAAAILVAFWPGTAQAMHIAEGFLPARPAVFWFVVAAPFLWWGIESIHRRRQTDPQYLMLVALVGSAIFVISCMPIPIPWIGSCSHPCGTGLGAVLIGPAPTVVVASVALGFQALFLGHGGLSTLGANIVSMGVVGTFAAYGTFRLLRTCGLPVLAAAFVAGTISDWATYATTAMELATGLGTSETMVALLVTTLVAFIPTQLPLGLAEGFLTAVAYRFLLVRRPELLPLEPLAVPATGEEG